MIKNVIYLYITAILKKTKLIINSIYYNFRALKQNITKHMSPFKMCRNNHFKEDSLAPEDQKIRVFGYDAFHVRVYRQIRQLGVCLIGRDDVFDF